MSALVTEGPPQGSFAALWRVLGMTAGRAAVQRGAALYAGLIIASAVLFGGNGLDARTVTRLGFGSTGFRLGLWAVWLLATLPVARALLATRATFFLRTLPVPRGRFLLIHAVHLAIAELPMLVLWTRGAGPLAGLAALVFGVGAHCALVAGLRRPLDGVTAALLLAALLAWPPEQGPSSQPRLALVCALAACALLLSLQTAWRRAPLLGPRSSRPLLGGPRVVALGLMHLLFLARAQRPVLLRGLLLHVVGLTIATLAIRNNHVVDPSSLRWLVRLVLVGPALLAASAAAGPVLRSERELRWLLGACGAAGTLRAAAVLWAIGALAAGLGILYGAGVGALCGLGLGLRLWIVAESAVLSLLVATLAAALMRWACRGEPRDGDRVVSALVLLLPLLLVAAWGTGAAFLPVLGGLGLLATLGSVGRSVPATRYGRLLRERHDGVFGGPEGVQ